MYVVGRNRQPGDAAGPQSQQRSKQIVERPVYPWSTILGPEPLSVMWSAGVTTTTRR
jgi:hypothetical protein